MMYEYKGRFYPDYLKNGDAVGHIKKIAEHFCVGKGLDIGGFYKWSLPGAIPINISDKILKYDAYKLPKYDELDYIFSSHCLEHLENPIHALEYWKTKLRSGGVMFLYLPHPDMEYWLPQNNKKHLHSWHPCDMVKIMEDIGYKDILFSERDMYWSFTVMGVNK